MGNPEATHVLEAPQAQRVISKKQRRLREHAQASLFLAPSVILLLVFVFYPIFKTLYYSFTTTNATGLPVKFVGLQNYLHLLSNPLFLSSIGTTLIFVLATTVLTISISLLMANVAFQKLRGLGIFRTFFASTMGVSVSVASVMWLFIFQPATGLSDQVLTALHQTPIAWLTSPTWALIAIIISSVWLNLGFSFLVLSGALQGVPTHLYESAEIDGATPWFKFWHITLPLISPTVFFVATVTLINAFQTFGQVDILTKGGPNNATDLLVYQIYQDAFVNLNVGQASTESIILGGIIALVTFLQFKFTEKKVTYQ
ncbi:sugar ABC transporter permease [Periweissella cryptocerci]|uniref:Sugar ABC transporter permease n=1 Tax=Periweissella cryptocerci TaxID=2506420 RepID=A0A4P6YR73_9LACO|nr:sugar ABC transporter permease [Periweissella cryptocerci]QBO35093.1 sugar ABC transporter permease [Periweissella cryptocerci]